MTDVYTPPAGSIPARAIAHLQSVGRGVDVRGADLAEAIACDAHNLKNYMATAVKHRIVRSASSGRGKTFYSLPVLDAFDEDEERGGKPSQRLVDAATAPSSAKRGPASVFELGGPTPPPQQLGSPAQGPQAQAQAQGGRQARQAARAHTGGSARTAQRHGAPHHHRSHGARALVRHVQHRRSRNRSARCPAPAPERSPDR